MADIKINQSDIDSLARKLDELSDVLTDAERALLLAVFGLASTALSDASGQQESGEESLAAFSDFSDTMVSVTGSMPKVSQAFRESFTANGAGKLVFTSPESLRSSVSVGGECITWSR